jgi:hypothetical protein
MTSEAPIAVAAAASAETTTTAEKCACGAFEQNVSQVRDKKRERDCVCF